ncbi:MAG: STAS domain-containing protein [Verrucomicrobiales bacterium]|nr:STAS domain-containing protein [Verrucomicrobiales bacterium]
MPIRRDFKGYSLAGFQADARSGFNVALLTFSQGMAYAVIAELPIYYGIVTGALAAMVAPFFSGSRHTVIGPTNATAFMLFSYFAVYPHLYMLALMPLLVFMIGVMLVIGAYLRVADLIQFISRSVVVGYISAAAVLIIVNQLRHVMGVDLNSGGDSGSARTFITILGATVEAAPRTHWQPLALGAMTFVLWYGLGRMFKKLPVFAITLLLMTVASVLLTRYAGFELETFAGFNISDLKPSIPRFSQAGMFSDVSRLFSIAFAVAFLAALENSMMSKTLASRNGDRPDMNQDMLGLGIANLACSMMGGMPASGSPTRSLLNFTSGAVSRLSSIISGVLVAVAAVLLGGYMDYVPKAVMAVLVICVAGALINRRHIRVALRSTRSDAVVLVVTFVSALLAPLNVAIFVGVGVSIVLYLRKASRPHLSEYEFMEDGQLAEAGEQRGRPTPAIAIVHVEGELFFGAAELFRSQIQKTCMDPNLRIVILRLKNARHLDATSVMALEELMFFLRSTGRDLIISGANKEVYRVLRDSGLVDELGRSNIFINSPRRPNLSTRNALLRAQELLGTKEADVKIFFDPSKKTDDGVG